MGSAAPRIATYDDVLNAPEGMTAEILAGELHLSPRPASDHGVAEAGIVSEVRAAFGRRAGSWWIVGEPELHLGSPDPKSVVVAPDVGGWRKQRVPQLPRAPAIAIPPDWVCEILSPGASAVRRDRILKPDAYAAAGIPHFWIVDPIARTLEVMRLRDGVYGRIAGFSGDVRVRAEPFDAVELDLGEWWLPEAEDSG